MKELLNHFIWMFGGICLIAVIVEFPYSIYQGTEFSLSASSLAFYLIFGSFYATYQVYKTKKAKFDQSTEPS
jgi:uncharacterized membrane protein